MKKSKVLFLYHWFWSLKTHGFDKGILLLNDLNGPKIVLGDDSETKSKGTCRIDIDHGSFNNIVYVQGISSNILLVYQMTHIRSPNKVVFSPNDVEITKILNGRVIAKGFLDHISKAYKFSHFIPFSNPYALLTHANEANNLWH